jgi:hypothetical protein
LQSWGAQPPLSVKKSVVRVCIDQRINAYFLPKVINLTEECLFLNIILMSALKIISPRYVLKEERFFNLNFFSMSVIVVHVRACVPVRRHTHVLKVVR